jgi:hypothetical protein
MEETLMVFGQGDTRTANLKTHIGEMEATVLDDVPTLISPVPVIEAGGSMHLEGGGGYIANADDSSRCDFGLVGGQWFCDLECLENFKLRPPPEPDPSSFRVFEDPLRIRRRAEVTTAVATARIYFERDVVDPEPPGDTHPALRVEGASHRVIRCRGDGVLLRFIELHERTGHLDAAGSLWFNSCVA